MGVALEKNLDVKQSWNRLAQASAVYVINRAGQLPALRINSGASITQTTDRKPLSASQQFIDIAESLGVPVIDGDLTTENIIVGGGLSYELDIWRRVNSLKASARLQSVRHIRRRASDRIPGVGICGGCMALSTPASRTIEACPRTTVCQPNPVGIVGTATERGSGHRFGCTAATPTSCRHRSRDSIDGIRIGYATTSTSDSVGPKSNARARVNQRSGPSEFTPLPGIGTPLDLLNARPDLRAARNRIEAADHDVAVAVAERLPRLTLNLTYDFQANELAGPFNRQIASLLGNLTGPIFEGGRRKAEVRRRQAILEERLNRYTQLFINALLEVENALVQERRQNELIFALEKQIGHARRSLEEARARIREWPQ